MFTQANAEADAQDTRHHAAEQEAVRATVREWIAAGLPDSTVINTDLLTHSVTILVRSRAEVDEWAAAVGRKPYRFNVEGGAYYSLPSAVYPAALNGWSLSVFCQLPESEAKEPVVQIRLLSTPKARSMRSRLRVSH